MRVKGDSMKDTFIKHLHEDIKFPTSQETLRLEEWIKGFKIINDPTLVDKLIDFINSRFKERKK